MEFQEQFEHGPFNSSACRNCSKTEVGSVSPKGYLRRPRKNVSGDHVKTSRSPVILT
jgi:hypothetical protein